MSTYKTKYFKKTNQRQMSQVNHQDSTIDPRITFDIQLFYFPTDVTKEMGGTRYHPGTHLRIVNEMGIAKYQNFKFCNRRTIWSRSIYQTKIR